MGFDLFNRLSITLSKDDVQAEMEIARHMSGNLGIPMGVLYRSISHRIEFQHTTYSLYVII